MNFPSTLSSISVDDLKAMSGEEIIFLAERVQEEARQEEARRLLIDLVDQRNLRLK